MFDTEILYLGYFCPDSLFYKLYQDDKDLSVAAHKFEKQLITNLSAITGVKLTIISYVSSVSSGRCRPESNVHEQAVPGVPIQYIWRNRGSGIDFSVLYDVWAGIKKWLRDTEGKERIALTYAVNPLLIWPLFGGRRSVRLVTICTEVPRFRIIPGKPWKVALKKRIAEWFNARMDSYVFLSSHMDDVVNQKRKPYIVIEGLPDIPSLASLPIVDSERPEKIFYAGYLHKENGIDVLLDAFGQLDRPDVSLMLCGFGDLVPEIERLAQSDTRICYVGSISNDRVLELEREATLLINPRRPDHLLTRYSFPSKTFEYFTSGTPTIMSQLDGVPAEYYNYCYTCDVASPEKLRDDIAHVLDVPRSERDQTAQAAFDFVVQHKSATLQVRRLFEFLQELV